jgi:SAM-dependent methyltransferase
MFKYIYSILSSYSTRTFILQNLVIIAILSLIYLVNKNRKKYYLHASSVSNQRGGNNLEGFAQMGSFVLKQDADIYDDFYTDIYDTLRRTISRSQWELNTMLKLTDADTKNSVFLDVGSGSGYKVDQLQKAGYKAFGVENSEAMIKRSEELFTDIIVKQGDIMEPMLYDKSIFTHVLCMNFTIYEFKNKTTFFRNCYHWMVPNSYLILHLVDPSTFNAVVPVSKNEWRQPYGSKDRLVDTYVKFFDFNYHAHYDFPFDKSNIVTLKESFTDNNTKQVRQNEQTLYMDSINDILKMANQCGFIFHAKVNMKEYNKDENQYLYVLERLM